MEHKRHRKSQQRMKRFDLNEAEGLRLQKNVSRKIQDERNIYFFFLEVLGKLKIIIKESQHGANEVSKIKKDGVLLVKKSSSEDFMRISSEFFILTPELS